MKLATFLIPPSVEERQAVRLRRLGLAALAYAMTIAMVAIGWTFGALSASAALGRCRHVQRQAGGDGLFVLRGVDNGEPRRARRAPRRRSDE
jgi:hypothetical protein